MFDDNKHMHRCLIAALNLNVYHGLLTYMYMCRCTHGCARMPSVCV